MASILSLDVGDVRVGLAVMDDTVKLPLPLGFVGRAQGEAERHILTLCQERNVAKIIIGLPLSENGSENDQSLKVRNFARRLAQRTDVELEFIDEYYSSEEALERLREQGVSRPEVGRVDALAATILLERYLDRCRESST
jgi:putative Holliday junction resolvase